jgi:hypothetical protein
MNMGLHFPLLTALTVEVCLIGALLGQTKPAGDAEPDAYTYKRVDGRELQVYVFEPPHADYGASVSPFDAVEDARAAVRWCGARQIY